ncbi:hypothetical protein [Burkholderia cepacia]|nr:hypothetical protein [Burkholderia cepacia]
MSIAAASAVLAVAAHAALVEFKLGHVLIAALLNQNCAVADQRI